MEILVVSATVFEIAPLLKELKVSIGEKVISSYRYKNHQISFLITGIGIAQTSFYLGKYLTDKYDLVINAGICGSFTYKYTIGQVVRINKDCFADLGAEDNEDFLSIKKLKLPGSYDVKSEYAFKHPILKKLKPVRGVTVNTVHGNKVSIKKFLLHTKADVESMEGAAFLFACNQNATKSVQIRSVSNYVERRDKSKWNIPFAIDSLNNYLINLIKVL